MTTAVTFILVVAVMDRISLRMGLQGRSPSRYCHEVQCRGYDGQAVFRLAIHSLCSLLLRTHLGYVLVATPVAIHGCCPALKAGNTTWQYFVSCPYDGNDANDGISLLEQGSVISVMSVIIIA